MELTKEQRDELQGLVDSLRKVPGNLCLILDSRKRDDEILVMNSEKP